MATMKQHWTERSIADFVYRISSDFVVQLEKKLEEKRINHKKLAKLLAVSEGRVSQVFNNPGNLTLTSTVEYARALNMKVAILAYDDSDPTNTKGPISSEIFQACWRRAGCPRSFFALGKYSVGRIHQLTAYPDRSENVSFRQMFQPWSEETATTSCIDKVH